MRERWCPVVDDIMQLQRRSVKFDDLVSFIDCEARIATNPVFGQITESSRLLEAMCSKGTVQKLLPKSRELSLAAQVNTDHGLNTEVNRSINIDTSHYTPSIAPVSNSCYFCNLNHALLDVCPTNILQGTALNENRAILPIVQRNIPRCFTLGLVKD